MKLEDLKKLHDMDTMRKFLAEKNIIATTEEIQTLLDVYEGHGYELFYHNKDDIIIRVYENPNLSVQKMLDKDCYDEVGDVSHLLLDGYHWLGELSEEYYEELPSEDDEDYIEELDSWKDCCKRENILSDLYSKYIDSKNNINYIVTSLSKSNFSAMDDRDVKVFRSEIDVYKFIKESVLYILENESEVEDFSGEYDLNDEIEKQAFLYNMREMDEISLCYLDGSVDITLHKDYVKEEPKIEFYVLVDKNLQHECYDDTVEVQHYKNKEDVRKEWLSRIDGYKDKWQGYFTKDNDYTDEKFEISECENDNDGCFMLYIENVCDIILSYKKVVL